MINVGKLEQPKKGTMTHWSLVFLMDLMAPFRSKISFVQAYMYFVDRVEFFIYVYSLPYKEIFKL